MISQITRDSQVTDPGDSGGGGLGGILGAIVGAGVAIATGGAALPAIGTAMGIGSAVGNAASPGRAARVAPDSGPQVLQDASQQPINKQRFGAPDAGSHTEVLGQALQAMAQAPPHIQEAYSEPLMTAYVHSMKGMGGQVNSGGVA